MSSIPLELWFLLAGIAALTYLGLRAARTGR